MASGCMHYAHAARVPCVGSTRLRAVEVARVSHEQEGHLTDRVSSNRLIRRVREVQRIVSRRSTEACNRRTSVHVQLAGRFGAYTANRSRQVSTSRFVFFAWSAGASIA